MRPTSAEEVAEVVREHASVAVRGGGTKEVLIGGGEVIEVGALTGITEYESSEYTFTAMAGTTVKEVEAALREKGQYLPFDPLLVEAGATLGGTIAAGTSGPGRFRYGGLRDFLIGVQFVDGCGKLVRSGGKVVKNAAGFDLPKFLVGSLGRFGILTEVSFKVFPVPAATVTLRARCEGHGQAVERIAEVASSRWEADALDYCAGTRELWIRLGGPGPALAPLHEEIAGRWRGEVEVVDPEREDESWRAVRELEVLDAGRPVAKVPLTPGGLLRLEEKLAGLEEATSWYSAGAAVGWIAVPSGQVDRLDEVLADLGLPGLLIQGAGGRDPHLGRRESSAVGAAMKRALDPEGKFPAP